MARDGHVVWFQCEARLVRREDGQPWFIHGVGFDITELKRMQDELREERNVVSAIFDTVGALIVVLDRDGRIVRFNRACEQMTGYSLEEAKSDPELGNLQSSPEFAKLVAEFSKPNKSN